MLEVKVQNNESIESALRRFRKLCDKEMVVKEARRREHYVKPSDRRRQRDQRRNKGM